MSTLSSAMSVEVSLPSTLASTVLLSSNWTLTREAPSITWALVRMWPLLSRTKPEPVATPCGPWPNGSKGESTCWTIWARTLTTPGASRL